YHDLAAFCSQAPGRGAANALAGTGDHAHFVPQPLGPSGPRIQLCHYGLLPHARLQGTLTCLVTECLDAYRVTASPQQSRAAARHSSWLTKWTSSIHCAAREPRRILQALLAPRGVRYDKNFVYPLDTCPGEC